MATLTKIALLCLLAFSTPYASAKLDRAKDCEDRPVDEATRKALEAGIVIYGNNNNNNNNSHNYDSNNNNSNSTNNSLLNKCKFSFRTRQKTSL